MLGCLRFRCPPRGRLLAGRTLEGPWSGFEGALEGLRGTWRGLGRALGGPRSVTERNLEGPGERSLEGLGGALEGLWRGERDVDCNHVVQQASHVKQGLTCWGEEARPSPQSKAQSRHVWMHAFDIPLNWREAERLRPAEGRPRLKLQ